MSADVPAPKPIPSHITKMFMHPSNTHLAHLQRILSTSTGIDSTLTLVGYSSILLSSQLNKLLTLNLEALALRFASKASKTLAPGESVVAVQPLPSITARIAALASGTKAFAAVCSDVRAFMRLWGLLSIWSWARSTYMTPPKDLLLRSIAWGQIIVNAAYLLIEHPIYLAGKGVIDIAPEKRGKWFITAARCFAAHIVLDLIKHWRQATLRQQSDASASGGQKVDIEARQKEDALWWKGIQVDTAYAPLALHWSLPQGLVSDTFVGAMGTWVGLLGVRQAWKQTA